MSIQVFNILIAVVAFISLWISLQPDSKSKKWSLIIFAGITLILTVCNGLYSWHKENESEAYSKNLQDSVSRIEKKAQNIQSSDSIRFDKIHQLLKKKGLRLQGDSILVSPNISIYKNSKHVQSKNQSGGQTGFEINNYK